MTSWRALLRTWNALRRAEHGAAAVELAILLPVLLLLVMGVVDFGHIFVTGIAVSGAAKAGAQYGAQSAAAGVDTTKMNLAATKDFNETRLGTLTVSSAQVCKCSGTNTVRACPAAAVQCGAPPDIYVRVTANQSVNLLFRYPGFGASVPVVRSALVRAQ